MKLTASSQLDRRDLWLAVLLAVITFAVFVPVLRHQFIESWDDSTAILTNPDYNPPRLANLAHYWIHPPRGDFYVPITYSLWGLLAMAARRSAPPGLPFNPAYFYAANLAAHVLCAVMVFLILRRLVPSRWPAWFGAALFALHPVQVEAVSNAWSVYTPLAALFGFWAIWQYLIFSERLGSGDGPGRRAWWCYALATIGFLLSLLTKPTAVTVPLMIVVIELLLRRRRFTQVLITLGPWLAFGLLFVWLNERLSPVGSVFIPHLLFRAVVPLDAIAFYLGKFFLPIHLVMDYSRTPLSVAGQPKVQISCLLTLVLFAVLYWQRRRAPGLLTGFLVFVAGVLPTIGIVPFTFQHYSTVADRYMYLGVFGLVLSMAFVLTRYPAKPIRAAALAGLVLLAALSVDQLRHWQDDWTLAAYTIETNPRSSAAVGIFRYLFTRWGHHDSPAHPFPAPRRCSLDQPTLIRAGDSLQEGHYFDLAEGCYRLAVRKGPPNADALAGLGWALCRQSDLDAARQQFSEALRIDPNNTAARRGIAQVDKMRTTPSQHRK